ncbi:Radical SAM domain protein [Methanococcus maripaludis C5]|uniref:Radical SAM domain protein n=1 Tax=Methanococcus maripaludis (strain C5 / ATCC BAA-1333) TaxID=402880 RepID=A4FYT2_METM5|nr:AmmeMemoRadiSam system radical SAM enzyme [Methanococcus maripaludis]ABO35366.1 Radical SAM domain protein [Methanococcus maripaludis C5]
MLKEALFYENLENCKIKCNICPRHCIISSGKRGVCGGRENIDCSLYAVNYGKICATAVDPIEKKPLFNYKPGTSVFSIATAGCNFKCKHCQNWEISQSLPEEVPFSELTPEDVVELAKNYLCEGIAYTYTEPTIFYEFMQETAKLAKKHDLFNVMVTNGYIEKEPLKKLEIDAMNIDIKGNSEFYKKICLAELEPVLETCRLAKKLGIHIEITNLVVPTYNDNPKYIESIINFVKDELGVDTPLHFTAFYPHYKLTSVPSTRMETIKKARDMALNAGLHYVYAGNVPFGAGYNTYCPECKSIVVDRFGYQKPELHLDKSSKTPKCPKCGKELDLIL